QRPHHRASQRAASSAGSGGEGAGPIPVKRASLAIRKRLPNGPRRRRHKRDGARPPTTGSSRINQMIQIISLLVENKPGALMRITGVLSARGYNIESLTVARTLDPTLSRMTIKVDVDPTLRSQVIKQMNKLINVLQAQDLTESPAVTREMVL